MCEVVVDSKLCLLLFDMRNAILDVVHFNMISTAFLTNFLLYYFQAVGLLAVILTIHWVNHFKGGVVWGYTELGITFNWHPILMTLGLIFLYGNGEIRYHIS